MPTRRRIALVAGFAGVTLAAAVLAAAPASASTSTGGHKPVGATPNCIISEYTNTCLRTVDGTPWSGNDNVRKTPSLSGQILTTLAFGHHTTVWCYKTGDPVSNNQY